MYGLGKVVMYNTPGLTLVFSRILSLLGYYMQMLDSCLALSYVRPVSTDSYVVAAG